MKLAGKRIEGVNEEIIVIPRNGEDGNIVFKARAILDMDEFDEFCPRPIAPKIRKRDGSSFEDRDDSKYKKKIDEYAEKRVAFMVIKSLEATEELEWETVNLNDSDTWANYKTEFKESGFSEIEINRIINGVMAANCLDETRLEEARKSFLAGQEDQLKSRLSLSSEQDDTQSGERASA